MAFKRYNAYEYMNKYQLQFNYIFTAMAGVGVVLAIIIKDYRTLLLLVFLSAINLLIIKRLYATTKENKSLFLREISDIFNLLIQASLFVILLVVICAYLAGMSQNIALLLALGVIVSLVPFSLFIINYLIFNKFNKTINIKNSLNIIDTGSVEYIVGEISELFNKEKLKVNEISVGKDIYKLKLKDNKSVLINQRNGNATDSQLENLQLLLSGFAKSQIIELKDLASQFIIKNNPLPNVNYQMGDSKKILDACSEIWDHAHVRKLTAKDRQVFIDYIDRHEHTGKRLVGFLYQEKGTKNKIFMGIACLEQNVSDVTANNLRGAKSAHIKLIAFSNELANYAKEQSRKYNLGTLIDADTINQKTDAQVFSLINKGALIYGASDSLKKRIVGVLNNKNKHVLACINNKTSKANFAGADIVLNISDFNKTISYIFSGRTNQHNMNVILRSILATGTAGVSCVVLSLLAISTYKIAPFLTPVLLIVAGLLLIPPLLAVESDKTDKSFLKSRPKDPEKQIFNLRSYTGLIGFGLIASVLTATSYLIYFMSINLSPVNLTDFSVPYYHHATTVAFVTFSLCTILYIIFERAIKHPKIYIDYMIDNKRLLIAIIVNIVLVGIIVYTKPMQFMFKTTPLGLVDVLIVLACGGAYILARQAQRYTRKHTRKAVLELHRELTKPRKLF